VPTTQSLSNRSPAGAVWQILCDQMSAELPKNPPERTGNQLQKERYYRKFRAPRGALRSCPAGLIAEVGLRWCGARPSSTEGGSPCQSLRRSGHPQNLHRPRRLLSRLGGAPVILGPRTSIPAQSNRALLRSIPASRPTKSLSRTLTRSMPDQGQDLCFQA
jgi:hypothetical protein